MTVPLITKADGTKFGKTESGAIWLDPKKTSPYAFYQFWLNTADADVTSSCEFFTFLPVARINEIEATDKASGTKPEAQRILAEEATRLVHGEVALMAARRITEACSPANWPTDRNRPRTTGPGRHARRASRRRQRQPDRRLVAGLAKSKSEARTFIQGGSVAINGAKADAIDHQIAGEERLFGRFTILRRGKKNYGLVSWQ
jgi:tyrosyl-tRNA synthetase